MRGGRRRRRKIQVFRIDDLFAPEVVATHPQLAARAAWELPLALLEPLAARARERGMAFGATPFGLWAVEAVAPHVDFLKVASYELLWHDLLRACAATGMPLIVSTGMATDAEIDAAVAVARGAGARGPHAAALRLRLPDAARAVQPRGDRGASRRATAAPPAGQITAPRRRSSSAPCAAGARRQVELHVDLPTRAATRPARTTGRRRDLRATIAACAAPPLDDASPADGDGRQAPDARRGARRGVARGPRRRAAPAAGHPRGAARPGAGLTAAISRVSTARREPLRGRRASERGAITWRRLFYARSVWPCVWESSGRRRSPIVRSCSVDQWLVGADRDVAQPDAGRGGDGDKHAA